MTPFSFLDLVPVTRRGSVAGALANAADLRRTLGVEADDGALVLHAYDRWGEGAGARLRGHYALALWDPAAGRLWAARER